MISEFLNLYEELSRLNEAQYTLQVQSDQYNAFKALIEDQPGSKSEDLLGLKNFLSLNDTGEQL